MSQDIGQYSIASIGITPRADVIPDLHKGFPMSVKRVDNTGKPARVGSVVFVDNKMEFFVCYKRCTKCEQRFRVSMNKQEAEDFAKSLGLLDTEAKRRSLKQRFFRKLRDYLETRIEG